MNDTAKSHRTLVGYATAAAVVQLISMFLPRVKPVNQKDSSETYDTGPGFPELDAFFFSWQPIVEIILILSTTAAVAALLTGPARWARPLRVVTPAAAVLLLVLAVANLVVPGAEPIEWTRLFGIYLALAAATVLSLTALVAGRRAPS